jgi:hypothetical protein
MTDSQEVLTFVEWLRTQGYYMKKVDTFGNEKFEATPDLVRKYERAMAGRRR